MSGSSSACSRLRRNGVVVGLKVNGSYQYPAFQFDHHEGRVRPIVAKVNVQLNAAGDPWGVASWWLSPSTRPDHASPGKSVV